MLEEKLKELKNMHQDNKELEQAKIATEMDALKRFIEQIESKAIEQKRIAQ